LSVESFDPGANALELSSEILTELMDAARRLDEENFGLTRERVQALAALARHGDDCDWGAAVTGVDSEGVVSLICLFTLAEKLPGWEAGPRSPVIALAGVLKSRGEYPDDLTAWIKANTDNRFLPYGSLMDRL
jgi:hypothetical protein